MEKRILSALLALALLLGCMPVTALAEETPTIVPGQSDVHLNPLYGHLPDALPDGEDGPVRQTQVPTVTSWDQVAVELRALMEAREESICINLRIPTSELNTDTLLDSAKNALDQAMVHTGAPTQGDYILGNYGGGKYGYKGFSVPSDYCTIPLIYTLAYNSTAAQEAAMDDKVREVLSSLDLTGTDYQKVRAIYDYITQNIIYAYDEFGNPDSRPVKHSSYGALVEGSAVCQGFATLLYRLLLEENIDCRYITGLGNGGGHAWNIIQLDGKYYNADSTWDINYTPDLYAYFLRNNANFTGHTRNAQYTASDFNAAYPMSTEDYAPPASQLTETGSCGSNLTYTLLSDGSLTITGSGAMNNYTPGSAPWYGKVTALTLDSGVTSIGDYAFYGCKTLYTVDIPSTVTGIGRSAFQNCKYLRYAYPTGSNTIGAEAFAGCSRLARFYSYRAVTLGAGAFENCANLTKAVFGSYLTQIPENAFKNCAKLQTITIPASVSAIGNEAFYGCAALQLVTFQGDGFTGSENIFDSSVTACYPSANDTWTEEIRASFGSYVNWIGTCTDGTANHTIVSVTAVAATCTEAGHEAGTKCSVCNAILSGCETIQALGHSFTNYVPNDDATCSADGTKTAKCDRCDATDTVADEGSKLAHSFTNYVPNNDATCTADGTKTAKCDHCDATDTVADEGSKLDHSFTNYVPNDDATCTADGTKTAKCDHCDATKTIADEGSKLDHSFTNYVPNNNATCVADGTKTAKCDHCDATDTVADEGSKLAHSFTNYVPNDDATCTADGTKTAKCDHCDATDTVADEGSKLGHALENHEGKAATCAEEGWEAYQTCKRCDYTTLKKINKLPHTPAAVSEEPATCTEAGHEAGTMCSVCHAAITGCAPIPAKGHTATQTPAVKATLTTPGNKAYYHCEVCDGYFADEACTKPTTPESCVLPLVKTLKISSTAYTYDGKTHTPTVGVYDRSGTKLVKDRDYTVSYASGRKYVGEYKVTIKGKGDYSFIKTLTFKINPPKTALSKLTAGAKSFTAKWSKKSSQVTGYQIQYSTKSSFSSAKTKTITKYSTTSATIRKLSARKTYYVRIRTFKTVGKTKFYSPWSSTLKVKTK